MTTYDAKRMWPAFPAGLLLGLLLLTASTGASALADQARPMAFRHLTVTDGLSQNTVMDVLQDSYGYIWFATENGLDRYDGHTVHRYQRGRTREGGLGNDYIWQIAEDADSNLWLATDGGGVAFWNRATDSFRHFHQDHDDPDSLASNRIRSLLITKAGIWVGTQDAGLALLDPATGRAQSFRHDPDDPGSLPDDSIYSLAQDDHGGLWIGTDAGVAWLQAGSSQFVRFQHDPRNSLSLSGDRIRALRFDRHGGLWVGTFGDGLNLLDRRSGHFTRYASDDDDPFSLSHDHVRSILEDSAGRIWIGTENGLNVLMPYARRFRRYRSGERPEELSDSYIMSLYQDRGGVLWVGTRTGGVNSWNSRSWSFGHQKPDWLERRSVTAFATDSRYLWVGIFTGGLARIDRVSGDTTRFRKGDGTGLSDDRVMSLLVDRNGALWVGTMAGGVNRLAADGHTFEVFRRHPGDAGSFADNSAMSLFEDNEGMIWIGSYGKGITRFDPSTKGTIRFEPDPDDPQAFCGTQGRDFEQDRLGTLWIATENGLCRYDGAARFTAFLHDESDPLSVPENSVYSLHRDGHGRLWVGTGGGGLSEASTLTDGTVQFRTTTRHDGLASNMIYGVRSDGNGQLWMSSNNGLTRYDPYSGRVRNYHRTHGLQGEEYHFGATHSDADGRLYFGGSNGFNSFDPLHIDATERPPAVVLTRVLKSGKPFDAPAPLATLTEVGIDYSEAAITFEFAALDYTEPENNHYRYRLEGFETDWIDAGNRTSATYTNLQGGNYVFRVTAASSDGTWNRQGLSVALMVAPPPWQTPIAYMLYVLLCVLALRTYIGAQRRRLEREAAYRKQLEREVDHRTKELALTNADLQRASEAKGEFLARMSHEIRSPIHGVLGMTELLRHTPLDDKQRKFADTIQSSTTALLEIINDVLDFSKLESRKLELDPIDADIEELVDEVITIFAPQAQAKQLELTSHLPAAGLPHVLVDNLRLRQVLINLLNNAVKFTSEGRIQLAVETVSHAGSELHLAFRVRDTGIGIAPEKQQSIFESFAQADSATTRRFGGTGLGLSISKELVELMGGQLNLASTPGEGSTFSFQIALTPTGETIPPRPEAINADVLVCCPRPALSSQLEHYLSGWGARCARVQSVQQAQALLERRSFDLIIVDHEHCRDDVLEKLRDELEPTQQIIVLMPMSAASFDASGSNDGMLGIPLRRVELYSEVQRLLCHKIPEPLDEPARATHQGLRGRVLVVEDSPVNREVLAGMLTELGCDPVFAEDGRSGVQAAQDQPFDAILMDFMLPDFDGVEAGKRIRSASTCNAGTPIIALTANASPAHRQQCLDAGMNDFLAKPCTMGELAATLQRWLDGDVSVTHASRQPPPAGSDDRINTRQQEASPADFDELALERIRHLRRPDGSEMLHHAVGLFKVAAAEALTSMRTALEQDDSGSMRFAAHKLKSSCTNLGAVAMAQLCRELEIAAKTGDLSQAGMIVTKLEKQHRHAAGWLEEQLSA